MTAAPSSGCPDCPRPGAISPSQIKLFAYGCQRKWAFRHILKLPEPERSFQTLGQDVHKHNELYLSQGVMPPTDTKAGQIANVGIAHLPQPSPHHIVEQHLHIDLGDLHLHGYADLIPGSVMGLAPQVYDYKTTSNLQYALTADELAADPQGLIYGKWLSLQPLPLEAMRGPKLRDVVPIPAVYTPRDRWHAAPPPIELKWLYYTTRAPYRLHEVKTTLDRRALEANFQTHVVAPAREMLAVRSSADAATAGFDPNALPGNRSACNAYGGCPYRARCTIHTSQTIGQAMSAISEEFRKRLGKTPATFTEPAPATALDEDGDEVLTELTALAEGVVPPDAPPPVTELPPAAAKKTRKTKTRDALVKETSAAMDAVFDTLSDVAKGYTLCINTMPLKGAAPVTLLSDVLTPIVKALSEDLGVTHYRLAKEADYGRGDALLLSAYKQTAPDLTGYVYADTRDADTAVVLSHIATSAAQIFRTVY